MKTKSLTFYLLIIAAVMSFILGIFLYVIYQNVIFIFSGAAVLLTILSYVFVGNRKPTDFENITTVLMLDMMEKYGALDKVGSIELDNEKYISIKKSIEYFFRHNPNLDINQTLNFMIKHPDRAVKLAYGNMIGFTVLVTDLNMFKLSLRK